MPGPKHLEARMAVLAQAAIGFESLPKHDGRQPAVHGEHLGFVREAMEGTALAWADGSAPRDDLRNALMETWWGQGIHNLYTSSGPGAEGWVSIPGRGLRAPWWSVQRHERATEKLVGLAKNVPHALASVEAVPGLSGTWLKTLMPPAEEAQWLADCRDFVLHAEQYAALRVSLGLPVDPVTPPVEPPVEPPEPVDPYVLKLRGGRFEVGAYFFEENGTTTKATPLSLVPITGNDGGCLFWFFSADNPELLVKVLDWRAVNGHWGVSYGSLSDRPFVLAVQDTKTETWKRYTNPLGTFASHQDMAAFLEPTA